jgi:hypothetical protein
VSTRGQGFGIKEINGLAVGIYRRLTLSALALTLSGCTFEATVREYLVEVFPPGTTVQISDSCSGAFGMAGGAAQFQVTFPKGAPPDLTALALDQGAWSREGSLLEAVEKHGEDFGLGSTVTDGWNCLRDMREDGRAWFTDPMPGLYFRSQDQTIMIMLPDSHSGVGVLFAQGR